MTHRECVLALLGLSLGCRGPAAVAPPPQGSAQLSSHLFVRDFPGATLAARIAAATAALPPGVGIVDAADVTGAYIVTRTVQVGTSAKPVELRLGNVTLVARVPAFHLTGRARLIGNGQTLVLQDSAANLRALINSDGVSNCEIAGLVVDGNRGKNEAPGSAIAMRTATGCRLHHLIVQNTVGYLHPAIAFFGEGNRDNTIEHNLVQDIGTLTNYADAIYVAGAGNKVLFNRIRRATDFGIVGEFCSGCVIHGNDIEETSAGIAVGSGIAGTRASANIIEGNTITGGLTTTWGVITIYRTSGAPPVSTIVRGNVVRDVELGHAIFVNGAAQVSLDGNLIGNIAPNHESYGIYIKDSHDVTVHDGAIDRTGSFGIGIGNSANVRLDGVLITDAARSGNNAPGIGLDVSGHRSTSISLTRLTIFDRAALPREKRMPYCIDFGQGGSTEGVLIADVLFDDGVSATGCRVGNINLNGASRVQMTQPAASAR